MIFVGSSCVCVQKEDKKRDIVLNTAGSILPLCNKTFCGCPGVCLCHPEWYLSLVQKTRRHVEQDDEHGESLETNSGGTREYTEEDRRQHD